MNETKTEQDKEPGQGLEAEFKTIVERYREANKGRERINDEVIYSAIWSKYPRFRALICLLRVKEV